MYFGNNIALIRLLAQKTQEEFAQFIGTTLPILQTNERNRTRPKPHILARIAEFGGVSVDDLLNKNLTEKDIKLNGGKKNNALPSRTITYKTQDTGKTIPIYDLHASASNVEMYADSKDPAFYVQMPGLEDCKFGMFVYGHSMYPTIENGSLVICREILDKALVLPGEIYVIATGDYRFVKRVYRSKKPGFVICESDNQKEKKKYPSFDLEIDKIRGIYLVKGIFKKTQS